MEEIIVNASVLTKIKGNYFVAMIVCCAVPLAAIAGLSLLGLLGSWGYYVP